MMDSMDKGGPRAQLPPGAWCFLLGRVSLHSCGGVLLAFRGLPEDLLLKLEKNMCSLIAHDPWKIPGVATLSAALARNRQMFRGLLALDQKEMWSRGLLSCLSSAFSSSTFSPAPSSTRDPGDQGSYDLRLWEAKSLTCFEDTQAHCFPTHPLTNIDGSDFVWHHTAKYSSFSQYSWGQVRKLALLGVFWSHLVISRTLSHKDFSLPALMTFILYNLGFQVISILFDFVKVMDVRIKACKTPSYSMVEVTSVHSSWKQLLNLQSMSLWHSALPPCIHSSHIPMQGPEQLSEREPAIPSTEGQCWVILTS